MKTLLALIPVIFLGFSAHSQNTTIFTDSLPGARSASKSSAYEVLLGANLGYTVDTYGEYLSANYSRIGRKWGWFAGLTKRLDDGIFGVSASTPTPGLNAGAQFYPNRFHSTFVPFFHFNAVLDRVALPQGAVWIPQFQAGYGNLIHFGKYLYLDWRIGAGLALEESIPLSASFTLGVGYNFVNFGRDRK